MNIPSNSPRLPRRTVIKWFMAASAALAVNDFDVLGQHAPGPPSGRGYGTDPKLNTIYNPGDFWPLTLTREQKETVTALADLMFPADDLGPAASAVRVPEFIDEWVSAPYPQQQADRVVVLDGLAWIESEAERRFGRAFGALEEAQQHAICAEICWPPDAKPELRRPAEFFDRFRNLAAGGYYGTPEGWKAIGYVGNSPSPTFEGPPKEVLERLSLEQTIV